MVRFALIPLILSISKIDLEYHQIDVKKVFLNEELDEQFYIDQPIGFEVKG